MDIYIEYEYDGYFLASLYKKSVLSFLFFLRKHFNFRVSCVIGQIKDILI